MPGMVFKLESWAAKAKFAIFNYAIGVAAILVIVIINRGHGMAGVIMQIYHLESAIR